MERNVNTFELKFCDNASDAVIKMNGVPLTGVTRINTGLIAGNTKGMVVIELLATSVLEMVASTLFEFDASDATKEYCMQAGNMMYDHIEAEAEADGTDNGNLSPMVLSDAFRVTLRELLNTITREASNG
jgi:hypothetical protein